MTLPVLPELPLSAPPPPTQDSLAGDWLYVPVTHVKDAALYPPEYIELRVKEDAGAVSGRYQARYRVPDQAISPNVVFRFRGRTGAEGGSLSWTGSGGAHGQLTLRLLANGALEVTWVADHLGTELGLVSGTATLVRKQE